MGAGVPGGPRRQRTRGDGGRVWNRPDAPLPRPCAGRIRGRAPSLSWGGSESRNRFAGGIDESIQPHGTTDCHLESTNRFRPRIDGKQPLGTREVPEKQPSLPGIIEWRGTPGLPQPPVSSYSLGGVCACGEIPNRSRDPEPLRASYFGWTVRSPRGGIASVITERISLQQLDELRAQMHYVIHKHPSIT
jgi:hypothetical protein